MSFTETITWHRPDEQLPDDGTTVLLDYEDGEPWPGWHEDGKWFEAGGAEVTGVIAWAEMPGGAVPARDLPPSARATSETVDG